jgi:hypothetical protein
MRPRAKSYSSRCGVSPMQESQTMQGMERTSKYVLIITIVLHTPVGYNFAMACLPERKFVFGGQVVHTSDCTPCSVAGLLPLDTTRSWRTPVT